MSDYRKLIVWRKAIELTEEIYRVTSSFPKEEIYGLTSQMRRAAVSTASNIAEGCGRSSKKDFAHFLRISIGSCAELETQVEIAKRLEGMNTISYKKIENLLTEILKMLYTMVKRIDIR